MPQNYTIVWIDPTINVEDDEYQCILEQLLTLVKSVFIFNQCDETENFVREVYKEKLLIIGSLAFEEWYREMHQVEHVIKIYLYDHLMQQHSLSPNQYPKVEGAYDCWSELYEDLEKHCRQASEKIASIAFASLDNLEPSFMYTMIFKNVLVAMENDSEAREELLAYSKANSGGAEAQNKFIERYVNDYTPSKAIWWYSKESLAFEVPNKALRLLEPVTLVNMALFIYDLHCQIKKQHAEQYKNYRGPPLRLYRGQILSRSDFESWKQKVGGLLSFNSFMSTSKDRSVAEMFAESSLALKDVVGLCFIIEADPSIPSTPFADITADSQFGDDEQEVLFSMHPIFRLQRIEQKPENDRLFYVHLVLTSDQDPDLFHLASFMDETFREESPLSSLANLLLYLGEGKKAEEMYLHLLNKATNTVKRMRYYQILGVAKIDQGLYDEAMEYFRAVIEPQEKILMLNSYALPASYHGIGVAQFWRGEYKEALIFFEKSLEIMKMNLQSYRGLEATNLSLLGLTYSRLGKHHEGISHLEQALNIFQGILPKNHPTIAECYHNLSHIYGEMGDHRGQINYLQRALDLLIRSLPENHPNLATNYNNIAEVYHMMANYSEALFYHEKALQIRKKALHENHPEIAQSLNNIGGVYHDQEDYPRAIEYFERALRIRSISVSINHPDTLNSMSNIGLAYLYMGDNNKGLNYLNKVLKIREQILPPNHPDFIASYINIAGAYQNLERYHDAIDYLQRAIDLIDRRESKNPIRLANCYQNIGCVYGLLNEFNVAYEYLQKAYDILRSEPFAPPTLMMNCERDLAFIQSALNTFCFEEDDE